MFHSDAYIIVLSRMDCKIFMPLRLVLVVTSMAFTVSAIFMIFRNKLHLKKKPMLYLLQMLTCQLLMAICAVTFSIVSLASN